MNYDQRNTTTDASKAKLAELVKLGEELGTWKLIRTASDAADPWRFVEVETPEGLLFSLSGGGWNKENKIECTVACRRNCNATVSPRDVAPYVGGGRQVIPEASVSYTRPTDAILRELVRRVIADPDAQELARKVNARLSLLQANGASLRAYVAKLEAIGYQFPRLTESQTHAAEGYSQNEGQPRITVNSDGRVTFECDCDIGKLGAVLAAMKG